MKKLAVVTLAAAFAATAFAQDPAPKKSFKDLSPAERQEKILRATGGRLLAPGASKGKVAIVNTQKTVPADVIREVAARISNDSKMKFEYQESTAAAPEKILAESKAAAAVIVVDDPAQPVALIALEDGWALVNVAKIGRNLKTDAARAKFIPSRTAKEVSRCTAILCGGSRSQFKGNVMDVSRLEDLDTIEDGLPMDRVLAMIDYLKAHGVTPEKYITYRQACMQGWAPAPTNDIQKAVWDKVHTPPKTPMTIEFDPKKGR